MKYEVRQVVHAASQRPIERVLLHSDGSISVPSCTGTQRYKNETEYYEAYPYRWILTPNDQTS